MTQHLDTQPGFVWRSVGDDRDPEQCQVANGSRHHDELPDGHEPGDCRCWVERETE